MSPVIYAEDTLIDQKEQFFEASVLHKIPTELLMQSSSSTQYFQSFPNGRFYRSWLLHRRKNGRDERLRKIAKYHAELLGQTIESSTTTYSDGRDKLPSAANNGSSDRNMADVDTTKNPPTDRNELLLDIALRTMVLIHHNQQLQNKLTALQMETRKSIRSRLKKAWGEQVTVKPKNEMTDDNNGASGHSGTQKFLS